MSIKVFKYKLRPVAVLFVEMPVSAQILSVGVQDDEIVLWALLPNSDSPTRPRSISVVGTGWVIPNHIDLRTFIGTVQIPSNGLVFHVFDGGFVVG